MDQSQVSIYTHFITHTLLKIQRDQKVQTFSNTEGLENSDTHWQLIMTDHKIQTLKLINAEGLDSYSQLAKLNAERSENSDSAWLN